MEFEILIVRKTESFSLVVKSVEDATVILNLLSTARRRARVMAEVKAFFDKQPIS